MRKNVLDQNMGRVALVPAVTYQWISLKPTLEVTFAFAGGAFEPKWTYGIPHGRACLNCDRTTNPNICQADLNAIRPYEQFWRSILLEDARDCLNHSELLTEARRCAREEKRT
jgi:hypothetical protein